MNVMDETMVHFVSYSVSRILISSNFPDAGFYRIFMLQCKMSSEQMEGHSVHKQMHIINLQLCAL
jgi:hypothetical protein